MSTKALIDVFLSFAADEQAQQLALWSHAATIDARGTYIPGVEGVADPVRLRRFNELQHRIAGRLLAATEGRKIDDGDFAAMVAEAARDLAAPALRGALEKSIELGSGSRSSRRAS
ncbi:MAG TPA: hypothetical protein VHQ47_14510 [Phycisphaerae bacterium]|nr:hypothetical protein [Phycisphaerae bacterium]